MRLDTAPHIVRTADGREIGYRRFGSGPPAVLLHASPRSAVASLPLGERLAERYTVFALDTPGFGWSQPLHIARPDAFDFGRALIEALDALGIARAAVYGTHTGATIAVAAAHDHPERIGALALDGYPIFTPAEQSEYAQFYLTPLRPDWAGTYLAWLWSRVKDQFTVFPWHLVGQWARLPRPLPTPAAMQSVVLDFLASGDHYRAAYAAAFRFDAARTIHKLKVATTVLARSDDLLFGHLDLLGALPDNVKVVKLGEDHTAWARAVGQAMHNDAAKEAPPIPKSVAQFHPNGLARTVVRVPGGTIGVSSQGRRDGRPLVLLPGIPGSAGGERAFIRTLGDHYAVLAIDLPGFGASHLSQASPVTEIAAAILAALGHLGVEDFHVVAREESASLACALAARTSAARLALIDPVPDAARAELVKQFADSTPRRDGSHLLSAWHQLRDRRLWRPWYDARPKQALDCGTDPDVESLHETFVDWMRGGLEGAATLASALQPSLAEAIRAVGGRTTLITIPGHPWSEITASVAAKEGVLQVVPAADVNEHASAIREAFAS